MSAEHVARNRASRERLAAVIERLGGRSAVLPDGWTAAALLAHLAFWDRLAAARLERYTRDREPMAFLNDTLVEYINTAGLAQWTRTPLGVAATDAIEAAAAADESVEGLSADDLAAVEALGRPNLLDRSRHRTEHLDQMERGLA